MDSKDILEAMVTLESFITDVNELSAPDMKKLKFCFSRLLYLFEKTLECEINLCDETIRLFPKRKTDE